MSDTSKQIPYESLGTKLKSLRVRGGESLAEVSGAVEIDETDLNKFEAGQERPSEDILLLLITHFGVQDDQAAELWQMAGYDKQQDDTDGHEQNFHHEREGNSNNRTQTMMIMIDPRVMYSDAVEVVANKQGVVVNFSQTSGLSGSGEKPLTVSRIGMSYHQAKMVMGLLHQALYDQDNPLSPRQLGDGSTN